MRLVRVSIEGYRSIKERLEVILDPHVTVLLGANDHGKTNFLQALRHLNDAEGFETDDLNWDHAEHAESLPALRFELELAEPEQETLVRLDSASRFATVANAAREDALSSWREANKALQEARTGQAEQNAEVESAAAAAKQAAEARAANPEDEGLRNEEVTAAARVNAGKEEQKRLGGLVEAHQRVVDGHALSFAIADGRAIEAEALREGQPTEPAVEKAASEQEALAETRSRSLKRLTTKLKAAQNSFEELPDDAEDGQRQKAESDLSAAQNEETQARKESEEQTATANRLRAAAEAIARIEAKDPAALERDLPVAELRKQRQAPERLVVSRTGLSGTLLAEIPEGLEDTAVESFLERHLPQIEMVEPIDKLPDDVSFTQLEQPGFAFMRGIFLYAGLRPEEWKSIFTQDPRSAMRLEQASAKLNETLRASWSQGKELTFRLAHDSKRSRITLEIKDPAVATTFTKPSRRSSGFTHFFALKTVLHALQSESPRSSYLWIFDEPGIHLHPDGQRDLIQVMETLGKTNQVLYTTHSIFLVNQNYPTRHRLLVRAEGGTVLDAKPFLSRWRTTLDALGLSLAGTVLFAPHVLLVEGDSDGIFVAAILRRLIADGKLSIDLNRFAAISTGDAANTDILLRILTDGAPGASRPQVGVLVDGDGGGNDRLKAIDSLIAEREVKTKQLSEGTTLEDHLPAAHSLYFDAVANYLQQIAGLDETGLKALRSSFDQHFGEDEPMSGLVEWTRGAAATIAGLDRKPSSVGIARAYVALLEEAQLSAKDSQRATRLGKWIAEKLYLPQQTLSQETILEE
jgi:predicted ATP-dependent endonuclease of OLD family